VRLVCEVSGQAGQPGQPGQQVALSWRRSHLQSHLVTKRRGEVLLSRADRSDTGDYVCETGNNVQNILPANKTVHLDVQYGPEITLEEVHLSYTQGDKIQLVCTVDASPTATVQWLLGPQGSTVDQTLTNVPYTQYDAKKILTRATIGVDPQSVQLYTCNAVNEMGSLQRQIYISGGLRDDSADGGVEDSETKRQSRKVAPKTSQDVVADSQMYGSGSTRHQSNLPIYTLMMVAIINLILLDLR